MASELTHPLRPSPHIQQLILDHPHWKSKGKGEGGWSGGRGRVPGRTGRRSRCCGFAEVLGFSRAVLEGISIGLRDFKMTAWSFQTSLTKWDPLTRPGWWDIEWNVSKNAVLGQKAVLGACYVRSVKCGPPQAGSIFGYGPAAGGLDFWEWLVSVCVVGRSRATGLYLCV